MNIKHNNGIPMFIFEKLYIYFTVNNNKKKTGKIMLIENRFSIKLYWKITFNKTRISKFISSQRKVIY